MEPLLVEDEVVYGLIMYPQCNMNNFKLLTGFDGENINMGDVMQIAKRGNMHKNKKNMEN